jgi:hypothetical protein
MPHRHGAVSGEDGAFARRAQRLLTGGTSYSNVFVASTPAGTSQVTIKATSGTITQTTNINLTVQ